MGRMKGQARSLCEQGRRGSGLQHASKKAAVEIGTLGATHGSCQGDPTSRQTGAELVSGTTPISRVSSAPHTPGEVMMGAFPDLLLPAALRGRPARQRWACWLSCPQLGPATSRIKHASGQAR